MVGSTAFGGLSAVCSDAINVFRLEFQPLKESLVACRVPRFKYSVPPFHLRVVQADLLEHRDPFADIHFVLHKFVRSLRFEAAPTLKGEVIDGSIGTFCERFDAFIGDFYRLNEALVIEVHFVDTGDPVVRVRFA